MGNVFGELKRRHVYRVAAAYAVVAWLLLQIVNNVVPIMQSPAWVGQFCFLLLALGFPVAIFFAWMRELPPSDAAAPMRATFTDWALVGVLVAVLAAVGYQQLAPSRATVAAAQGGVDAARDAAAKPAGVSLAVLPFMNLSGDPAQEFFSDGMTAEITAALAKIADLRVVARTSAYQFKGENKDMRAIGQALGATHLIDGSVRKEGDRVRITAQLVQADNGVNVWTENYDRQLTGVFAIQEDIATAITKALRMPLGLAQGERLISNRTIDPESYQQYLHAKQLVRARSSGVVEALEILEPLVARNSDYAPAWALLATAYGVARNSRRNAPVDEFRRFSETIIPKSEAAARRAIQLDPNLIDGYLSLTIAENQRRQLLLVENEFSKALALDPNNPDALNAYRNMLLGVGRLKEALTMGQQLRALEPFVPLYNANLAESFWLNGQDDAAITMIKDSSVGDANRAADLARIYAAMGNYSEAADTLREMPSGPNLPAEMVADAERLLRTAPAKAAGPQNLPRLGTLGFVYLYVGAPSRALEYYEGAGEAGFFSGPDIGLLWHPSFAPARKTERFKAFMRKAGFAEYWRAKGWPEFCRPTTGDDFECT